MDIELPNGRIHAVKHGSGTPVLIMHGGGLDHRHMEDALEPVFENTKNWMRTYIDLPGHGASWVDESVTHQDDVLNMISSFASVAFNGKQFAVIGESRGSYHAMGLVHNRPQDILGMMLIVADGMQGATVDWRPEHQTLVSLPQNEIAGVSPEAKARFARLVVQSTEILEKIERTKVPASKLADQEFAKTIKDNFNFSFNISDNGKVFDRPCLILNGRQDAMAGYQDMIERFEAYPRATLAVLDCAGHSLAWEQPALFSSLTVDWLRRMRF